jgi:hypothetical protein
MTSLLDKIRHFRTAGGKAALGLIFASVLGVSSPTPALADRDDWGGGWGGRGWGGGHEGWRGDDDGWHRQRWGYGYGNNYGYGGYGGGYQQPYGYAQPVYVPPPVYYPPQQSPGINLVFPLNFR